VSNPSDPNVKLKKDDEVSNTVDPMMYQSMIGSLLYAAIATRLDISQAIWLLLNLIFRYLKGTVEIALTYMKSDNKQFVGYSDAGFAGDLDDRHSTTGNIILLSNGALSWLSKKQQILTLSTVEAKYVSLSTAVQESVRLRKLLKDFGVSQDQPSVIMEDNQGAIFIAKNPVAHSRTKHIDIRYHYIREA